MNEQIYKLTDKGLTEFSNRLFFNSQLVCGCIMIDEAEAYEILLDVIERDEDNVREIEERNSDVCSDLNRILEKYHDYLDEVEKAQIIDCIQTIQCRQHWEEVNNAT